MPTLRELLTQPSKENAVIEDCCTIVDQEVADKGGISGIAIKAGYKVVQGIKPGFVRKVVKDLLPEFADALDPIFQEANRQGRPVASHFEASHAAVADALIAITDGKAQKSTNGLVKGTYSKLRSSAKKNVEAAVPRLGRLIERHGTP